MNMSIRSLLTAQFTWWVAFAIAACAYLFTFDGLTPRLRKDRLNFGIDLVGGTYITLGVQTDKAIEAELSDKLQYFLKKMKEHEVPAPTSYVVENGQIKFTFPSVEDVRQAVEVFGTEDRKLVVTTDQNVLNVRFKESVEELIRKEAVQGNIAVLRSRLDAFGVGEISIAAQGDKHIVVELPNVNDPAQAERIIGRVALLEFKRVERTAGSREELLDEYDGELPDDLEILPGKERSDEFGGKQYFLVSKFTDVTGRSLKNASMGFGEGRSGAVVQFEFTADGGEKFYEMTKKSIGRPLAIILDGVVISAPNVNTAIRGKGMIEGGFTTKSATELATLLKSGAFVAPVTFEERRKIGPSLGQESIDQGLTACLVALVLLVIFGIAMYKVAGFFAVLALVYNLLLIMLALSFFGATLTLPGIAGMVLTIGMAIDASILIYEKMREELAAGVTPYKAMQVGFSDAMMVILDSNITTFIVGGVLYYFGTGPIQGFAVTMMIGVIVTLITGLFFLRSLFVFAFKNLGMQKVKV
jgi:preprotein translocase subunit SecD